MLDMTRHLDRVWSNGPDGNNGMWGIDYFVYESCLKAFSVTKRHFGKVCLVPRQLGKNW